MSEMQAAVDHPTLYSPMPYKGDSSDSDSNRRFEDYKALHKESIENPGQYWDEKAKKLVDWFSPYSTVNSGDFLNGDISKLNIYIDYP